MTHLQAFQRALSGKAEAALISSPQNIFYLSLFDFSDGYLLILPDAAYLITDFSYEEAARAGVAEGFEVISPETGVISGVFEKMKAHRATTLWVEEDAITLAARDRLHAHLDGVELLGGAGEALAHLRERKDKAELAAMSAAQELTDAAFTHILDYISPTRTERDVALELEFFMRRNGADGIAFDTIAVSGSASSLPHGVPRDHLLEKGFLTMDFGARFGGYCADMTRTVVIGHADEEMKHLYRTVLQAQKAALALAAGGIPCRDMDKVARDIIHNAGYAGCFGHSLGHGVGLDVHEAPRLSAKAAEGSILLPGHVVTVEPGIYIVGKYGCRIEDMIAVNEDGSIQNFTNSPKELIELCR